VHCDCYVCEVVNFNLNFIEAQKGNKETEIIETVKEKITHRDIYVISLVADRAKNDQS